MIMEIDQNRGFTITTGSGKQSNLPRPKNSFPHGSVVAPLLCIFYAYDPPSFVSKKYVYDVDLALLHSLLRIIEKA